MGRLAGHCVYLAGPMEHVEDNGVTWRQEITPWLHKRGVGVFDPCDKPIEYAQEDEATYQLIDDAKDAEDWPQVKELCKPFVSTDLRMVHLSSFIILYVDKRAHMCGSYVEYTWAIGQRKPVLVMVEQGKRNASGFIWGMSPPELIFGNWNDLKNHLVEIDEGKVVSDLKRWTFFDWDKVYGRKMNYGKSSKAIHT